MAGSESAVQSGQVLACMFGGVLYTPPEQLYLGLWTSALDDDSDGDTAGEAAYGSYARTAIGTGNNQDDAWDVPNDDGVVYVTNMNDITCPTCTSGSATITYGAVLDQSESGNILVWFPIASTSVVVGNTPVLGASNLRIERT